MNGYKEPKHIHLLLNQLSILSTYTNFKSPTNINPNTNKDPSVPENHPQPTIQSWTPSSTPARRSLTRTPSPATASRAPLTTLSTKVCIVHSVTTPPPAWKVGGLGDGAGYHWLSCGLTILLTIMQRWTSSPAMLVCLNRPTALSTTPSTARSTMRSPVATEESTYLDQHRTCRGMMSR